MVNIRQHEQIFIFATIAVDYIQIPYICDNIDIFLPVGYKPGETFLLFFDIARVIAFL